MKPRINNPGWVHAVQNFVDVVPYGPPGRINFDIGAMRAAFVSGDAALVYEWGDIASEEFKPNMSVVNGLVGCQMLPGAEEVWNSKTNAWDAIPNHRAPMLNFGGWTHGVTATTQVADAAFDFAAFMGSVAMAKRLAVGPDSGINPGRYSQLGDVSGWVNYGLKESDTVPYLNAIKDTYTHPNVVFDLSRYRRLGVHRRRRPSPSPRPWLGRSSLRRRWTRRLPSGTRSPTVWPRGPEESVRREHDAGQGHVGPSAGRRGARGRRAPAPDLE